MPNLGIDNQTAMVQAAARRRIMTFEGNDVVYHIVRNRRYRFTDPEEQVRADCIAYLVIEKGYDPHCIDTEVRGSHNDFADVVLHEDADCRVPYLVVENKKRNASASEQSEGEGQAFANAIALGATYAMLDYGADSMLWDVANYPARERTENYLGGRQAIPVNYSTPVQYRLVAGSENDISAADSSQLETAIRSAHAVIWSGGKRDPLDAFDEWSKLMLAKVWDERYVPNGEPRGFQVGLNETDSAVATRVHDMFMQATERERDIFPEGSSINLPDAKVAQVVRRLQDVSFLDTDADTIGIAFESFYGAVFRGQLGQYFTMRPIARFTVAMLDPTCRSLVIDPTCGSGGFLLETLLQVWRKTDRDYAGRSERERIKDDFAKGNVYGVEIFATLARICKISLLLHHDGHTNIEADKSCLSTNMSKTLPMTSNSFDIVVGNPPFGTKISRNDDEQLDGRSLDDFDISRDRSSVASEHVILEHSVRLLKPGGLLGMVLPDGILNNKNDQCLSLREWLFSHGKIQAVVSLPDYAFRRSGATNKTSILVFKKFEDNERKRFDRYRATVPDASIPEVLRRCQLDYGIFFAEASFVGYTPSGAKDSRNDLYNASTDGSVAIDQTGSILGAWRAFLQHQDVADSRCVVRNASDVWCQHDSHRIDPKYHVYLAHERDFVPDGWATMKLGQIVQRRLERPDFTKDPMREYGVLTLSQTGDIRLREPGVGNNPPEWRGMYFAEETSSSWYVVHEGDIVYSGIDLWKGVVCYVTAEYDGCLVTQEYPILHVTDQRVSPRFLAVLLRSSRFRRVFRAINTGHSNRRRTQQDDFFKVDVFIPGSDEQEVIASADESARIARNEASHHLQDVQHELDVLLHASNNVVIEYEF